MTHPYATLPHIPLAPDTGFVTTEDAPEPADLDTPAEVAMTRFSQRHPVTIEPGASIDTALDRMKAAGVRMLFVVNEAHCIVGLITSSDILGEGPVKIAQQSRMRHDEITVDMIMTPQDKVTVLDMASVANAKIGHVLATLKAVNRRHMFVVERDGEGGQRVVGLFSATEIGRALGRDLREEVAPAHSLAELVQSLR